MNLLQTILDNKYYLKEDKWFYPQSLLEEFGIDESIDMDNFRLSKKWFESWVCTDTTVGIAVYFFLTAKLFVYLGNLIEKQMKNFGLLRKN